ncbi:hypothetical protein Avbf_14111 [Armadillidium vulgare]|nr:hypothetical protein Avbf_14111 [Armadillidium vulgare]
MENTSSSRMSRTIGGRNEMVYLGVGFIVAVHLQPIFGRREGSPLWTKETMEGRKTQPRAKNNVPTGKTKRKKAQKLLESGQSASGKGRSARFRKRADKGTVAMFTG